MDAFSHSNDIHFIENKSLINGNINCYMKSMNDQKMSIEDQFNAAVNVIKKLPKNGLKILNIFF